MAGSLDDRTCDLPCAAQLNMTKISDAGAQIMKTGN